MKTVLATDKAPAAIGPYSQAIRAGDFLFVSGQLPIDPATGAFSGESIAEQTARSLENVRCILLAAGMDFSDVVKATVFLSDMNHFAEMNRIYASCFSKDFPARAAVEVARLPKDALVEIEAIAYKPKQPYGGGVL